MAFQKFHNKLKIVLLSFLIATSFVPGAAAQSAKDLIRQVVITQVLADRTPVRALSNDQLLWQRKKLAKFVRRKKGSAQLLRNAAAKLRVVEVEMRNRNIAIPGKPAIVAAPKNNPNRGPQNQAALRVLADERSSASLSRPQLRQRINRLRNIIANRQVRPALLKVARNMRASDAAELRRRNGVIDPPQLFAVLKDRRPSVSLPTPQLRQRIRRLSQVIAASGNRPRQRSRARNMHAADIKELKNRSRVASPAQNVPALNQILSDRRVSRSLSNRQLERRIGRLENLLERQSMSKRNRKTLKRIHTRDVAELKRRRAVVQPPRNAPAVIAALRDKRTSQSLSSRELKRRISRLAKLIDTQRLNKRQKRTLATVRARDVAELNRRRAVVQQPPARTYPVLRDRRPAARLSIPELRDRVAALRNTLRQDNLPRPVRKQLTRKLISDRTVLRRRVAEQRARQAGERFQPVEPNPPRVKLSDQARRLLTDYRSSRALNKRQLNTRIRAARNVLKFVALRPFQRAQLRDMLKLDRAEKSRRLIAARDRRQAKLDRLRARGQLRIEINPGFARQPNRNGGHRGDLAAAEADEGQIQRQFLEPAPQNFERRYSREEIVRRPDLTRRFAGIDVDTVNFGFNEYWIREEEVDELERMAVTIERILAARPYEVFQIEGHTDAVGSDAYNLKLSRQRAEAVKNALTKFFIIPSRALVTVGLGERYLKIPTLDAESENRRVTIRRITPIVRR